MDFSITRLALAIMIAANASNLANLIERDGFLPASHSSATLITTAFLACSFGVTLLVSVLAQRKYHIRWLEI